MGKKGNTILKGLTGYVKAGRLTAIMGSTGIHFLSFFAPATLLLNSSNFGSGAGKSTFIDILAGRSKSGKISGTVLVNGVPPRSIFNKIGAYVLQQDLVMVRCFLASLT